jgi:HD-like signal output (HDOD) protein
MAERDVLGFDHGEVGSALMRAWNLPDSFRETTLHHHEPSLSSDFRLETAVIHLADVITGMAHGTASGTRQPPLLEPGAWELTGLSVDIVDSVIAEADAQFGDACAAILPDCKAA